MNDKVEDAKTDAENSAAPKKITPAAPKASVSAPKKEEDSTPFNATELIPWTWNIKKGNREGEIEAVNLNTGREFKGKSADFNEKLRG
jgi:hypothetical protein